MMEQRSTALALCLGLLLGCGGGVAGKTQVIVSVSGLDGVRALRVRATRDGVPATSDMVISAHLAQFVVEVPADAGHLLDLSVAGLDDLPPAGCTLASGSVTGIALSGQQALTASVALGKIAPTCTLAISPKGSGSVRIQVAQPAGLMDVVCSGACSHDFPKGSSLHLLPVPDARSYIDETVEGTLSCPAQGPCSLPDLVLSTSQSRTLFSAKQCSADGWCGESLPPSSPQVLRGVWGSGADDVWGVGFAGMVLHFNGVVWRSLNATLPAANQAAEFQHVWGSGPQDVWAVGSSGAVLRWNGTGWDVAPMAALPALDRGVAFNAVWGSGPQDVWLGGDSGVLLEWNGTTWIDHTPTSFPRYQELRWSTIWGSGPKNVAFGGGGGSGLNQFSVTAHWDGQQVQLFQPDPNQVTIGLWGTGPDDLWGAGVLHDGSRPAFTRFGGTSWQDTSAPSGLPPSSFPLTIITAVSISGTRRGEVWSVGGEVDTVAGQLSSSNDNGFIAHFADGTWKAEAQPGGRHNNLLDVWASPSGDVFTVGTASMVYRRVPVSAWQQVASGTDKALRGVHGGAGNVWAVGDAGTLLGLAKGAWVPQAHTGSDPLARVWQGADGHAFAVGGAGVVQQWDGKSWTLDPFPGKITLSGVWAASSNDALAGGQDGFLFHRTATGWAALGSTQQGLLAGSTISVWGRTGPPATYFTASTNGLVLSGDRSGGDASKVCGLQGSSAFTDIKGVDMSGGDVWLSGLKGALLRVQDPGTGLVCQQAQAYAQGNAVAADLYGLWVAPGDSWAVGAGGTILHHNGNAWAVVPSGTTRDLHSVWAPSGTDVWAVGDGGTILHYGPAK